MARVRNPLFSLDAVGAVGSDARFRRGVAGTHVVFGGDPYSRNKTSGPSESQLAVRRQYGLAFRFWQFFGAFEQESLNQEALEVNLGWSGWNLFLKRWNEQPGLLYPDALLADDGGLILLEDESGSLLID